MKIKRALRVLGIALGLVGTAVVLAIGASSALAGPPPDSEPATITIEIASPTDTTAEIPPTSPPAAADR